MKIMPSDTTPLGTFLLPVINYTNMMYMQTCEVAKTLGPM